MKNSLLVIIIVLVHDCVIVFLNKKQLLTRQNIPLSIEDIESYFQVREGDERGDEKFRKQIKTFIVKKVYQNIF